MLNRISPITSNIRLRLAEENDAAFILSLRIDPNKNKYLSNVGADVDKQREWLRAYKQREQQGQEYYFVIEDAHGLCVGVVRMYDFQDHSFFK